MAADRILVVDDDRVIQELLRVNLEIEGYEVQTASDGEEALRRFEDFRPALVLLDIMMPKLDGWEVARRLRGHGAPVVLLSARAEDAGEDQAGDGSVAAYVAKPFDPGNLLDLIAELLASSARELGAADAAER
jgi:DNA-binding response OmpR family regulator